MSSPKMSKSTAVELFHLANFPNNVETADLRRDVGHGGDRAQERRDDTVAHALGNDVDVEGEFPAGDVTGDTDGQDDAEVDDEHDCWHDDAERQLEDHPRS